MKETPSVRQSQKMSCRSKRGGWRTFPFIIGTVAGLTLAGGGVMANLVVYLIREFNIKSITAAQISNVVAGTFSLFPIVGAIIADSLFGSFTVAFISSFASLVGTILLFLTATINSLRPQPCKDGSKLCETPSELQYGVLYLGIGLAATGFGGSRFTIATLGANQFDKKEHEDIYFNWFYFTLYIAFVVGLTAIVYIEDQVSWALAFGLCGVANLIAIAILSLGYRFYRTDIPQGNPFLDLARVLVATLRKWKSQLSSRIEDYYGGHDRPATPGQRLRFFNRAALITEGDIQSNGSIAKPWRLCTVEQVEDFKALIGILPLWSSSIFLSTPIAIQSNFTILQALTMDRHLGSHFTIPAASVTVVIFITTAIFLTLLDRVLYPTWQKLIGKSPTPLQRLGAGHVFNVLGMMVSALVESKRLKIAHTHQLNPAGTGSLVAMSTLWLFPQLILVGMGEAFHFPGQVSFYYQQFPESLRSTATAMIALIIGISYYLCTAIIDLVRRVTDWLPDDINNGRMNNVYWMLVVMGVINFGYYLLCSSLYKNRKV